mmetsp:Transcript_81184/g.196830  ORF Transcript_81184/g.196830 Transcript_81184/m.196830 type:complete len:263 (+) Transcript_81184:435-1223(+)
MLNRTACHRRCILLVSLLEQRHVQVGAVALQLLDCAGPESIARCDEHAMPVGLEVVRHLRKTGALAHAVDPDKHNHERLTGRLLVMHSRKHIRRPLCRQNATHRVGHRRLHRRLYPGHGLELLPNERRANRLADLRCGWCRHILCLQCLAHFEQWRLKILLSQHLVACDAREETANCTGGEPSATAVRVVVRLFCVLCLGAKHGHVSLGLARATSATGRAAGVQGVDLGLRNDAIEPAVILPCHHLSRATRWSTSRSRPARA